MRYLQDRSRDINDTNLMDLSNTNVLDDHARLQSLTNSLQFAEQSPDIKARKDKSYLNNNITGSLKPGVYPDNGYSLKYPSMESTYKSK